MSPTVSRHFFFCGCFSERNPVSLVGIWTCSRSRSLGGFIPSPGKKIAQIPLKPFEGARQNSKASHIDKILHLLSRWDSRLICESFELYLILPVLYMFCNGFWVETVPFLHELQTKVHLRLHTLLFAKFFARVLQDTQWPLLSLYSFPVSSTNWQLGWVFLRLSSLASPTDPYIKPERSFGKRRVWGSWEIELLGGWREK